MQQLSITRTKDFIIFKIPVKSQGRGAFRVAPKEEELIQEGLEAMVRGQVSKKFKSAREATRHLRGL